MDGKVFIVDDNQAILSVLEKLLVSIGLAVTTFDDGHDFLDHYHGEPGCVILDLRLPTLSGIKIQETLQKKGHSIPIIFISGHGDIAFAVKAIKNGAVDFITKPFVNQELIDTVQMALHMDQNTKQKEHDTADIVTRLNSLTSREKEMLAGIVAGKLTKQIAHDINISVNTAEVHRAHVMQKMKAKTLGHLLGMVFKHDLMEMLD